LRPNAPPRGDRRGHLQPLLTLFVVGSKYPSASCGVPPASLPAHPTARSNLNFLDRVTYQAPGSAPESCPSNAASFRARSSVTCQPVAIPAGLERPDPSRRAKTPLFVKTEWASERIGSITVLEARCQATYHRDLSRRAPSQTVGQRPAQASPER